MAIYPKAGESASKKKFIELDYAMIMGQVILETRQAMGYYVLQRLGLSRDCDTRPERQPIQLKNPSVVKAILERLAKSYD